MPDLTFIHFLPYQPGWIILAWTLFGWLLCTGGILLTDRYLQNVDVTHPSDTLGQLRASVVSAWPVYWLAICFLLVDRQVSWEALVAMTTTLLVLPSAVAGLLKGSARISVNMVPSGFLVFVMLVYCGAGLGIDREFERLEGHIVLTLFLLYLWWDWRGRKTTEEGVPTILRPWPSVRIVLPLIGFHVGAVLLFMGVQMLTVRFRLPGGIVLGLLLALAWTPSLVRGLLISGEHRGFLITSLPLVILFLAGVLVLLAGGVDYPITVWQMEACSGLVVAVLWLGLGVINQPLGRLENLLLMALYAVYLGLRVFRLF